MKPHSAAWLKKHGFTNGLWRLNDRHDQRIAAERKWQQRKLAPAPQQPCDIGLFSDEANQLDLVEMLMDPTNGE